MIEQIADLNQLQEDILLLHEFIHGSEGDSVKLGRVNTPTLRNLVATINNNVALLISELQDYKERISSIESALAVIRANGETTVVDGDDEYRVQVLAGLVKD